MVCASALACSIWLAWVFAHLPRTVSCVYRPGNAADRSGLCIHPSGPRVGAAAGGRDGNDDAEARSVEEALWCADVECSL
jgi:hypothetical protein